MDLTTNLAFCGLNNIRGEGSRCQTHQKDCATGPLQTFLDTLHEHVISP
jgi:hypothetical protein